MERTLKGWAEANPCTECREQKPPVFTPATHSTTDAVQTTEGWTQSDPRFGCKQHPVKPFVILQDGTKIPFAEYHVN
jgi:hypothetical protein